MSLADAELGRHAWRCEAHEETRAISPLTLLAGAFAVGIMVSHVSPTTRPNEWLMLSGTLLLVASSFRAAHQQSRLRHAIITAVFIAAMITFGAAWTDLRLHTLAKDDLAAWIGDETRLVRVEGVARASPTMREYANGSLGRFDYRPPASVFPMRVESLWTTNDERVPVAGNVLVRVGEIVPPFRPGDRIKTVGHLRSFDPPRNPGEFDAPTLARALRQAGALNVSSRDLVEVTPANRPGLIERWIGWREALHRRAAGWLLAHLPESRTTQREAMLKALLLGQREPDLDEVYQSFQRIGLAHLLAISGLHLGIVAGLALLVLRAIGLSSRAQAWWLIGLTLVFLALIEVRMPVLRAGIMLIAACTGLVFGRRYAAGGLVALSALLLLMWRPDQLFNAGFQLSYGVVLGLIHLSPIVRRRWFPSPRRDPCNAGEYAQEWLRAGLTVAVTSWLVATPIVMHHFGFISPLGALLSVPAVPMVGLMLAVGYLKMVLELIMPSAALLLATPLTILADALIAMVLAIDAMPGSVLHVPFPSAWWSIAALAFACAAIVHRRRAVRRLLPIVFVALVVWLYWGRLPIHNHPALRIDMLAVGHGTCIVLRSGGETFVFDAGSMSRFDIGERAIVPALRRLDVRTINALAISHPHIDHYSAVIELADAFNVERVLTTHQFIERAREQPFGPVAYALDGLTDRFVRIELIVKGQTITIGEATLTWLHPPNDLSAFQRDNEHSMVVRVDVAGRIVLLTGDVEREGLAHLASRKHGLRACIVEIPHHGSYNDLAAAFIAQLEPQIAMQSSSGTQWRRDRWQHALEGVERLVTYRDGMCTILIHADGSIEIDRFLEHNRK